MTSLVAWVGIDNRGPASIYVAADSRLSSAGVVWDHARKVFAIHACRDLIGYCGEAMFPSQVLSQVCAAIEVGMWQNNDHAHTRAESLCALIKDAARGYPKAQFLTTEFIYCTRQGSGMGAEFFCYLVKPSADKADQRIKQVSMPTESGILVCLGSGAKIVRRYVERWTTSGQAGGRTSRAVFSGFCDAIGSGGDRQTGGSPQLCGLYREGTAMSYGLVWESKRFFLGLNVSDHPGLQVEWRNRRFERVDANGDLLPKAQRQPSPRSSK